VSGCSHLLRVDEESIVDMPFLKALTVNNNRRLRYFHPHAIKRTPTLSALDLSGNALFALERDLQENLPQLKAIYLTGNNFHCHCSFKWLETLRPGELESRVARWFVFKPNIPIWVNFGWSCNIKSWYILRAFGLFNCHWKYFMAIWYIL
jgi:hypothetical protein